MGAIDEERTQRDNNHWGFSPRQAGMISVNKGNKQTNRGMLLFSNRPNIYIISEASLQAHTGMDD